MTDELNKIASILVDCGYGSHAEQFYGGTNSNHEKTKGIRHYWVIIREHEREEIDPYADTLEGRRQLESVWNWIMQNKQNLLIQCTEQPPVLSEWDDRDYIIRRTKWCIKQLTKQP
jgi:hypothetical protein